MLAGGKSFVSINERMGKLQTKKRMNANRNRPVSLLRSATLTPGRVILIVGVPEASRRPSNSAYNVDPYGKPAFPLTK